MKCKVTLYDAGTVFEEIVIARDYQQAKQKAMARNPGSTHVSTTAIFDNNSSNSSSSSSSGSNSSSGGSSSSGSGEGLFGLAIIIGAIWALMTFLPWFLMGLGGWFGAWAGNKTGKVSLALILSLLAGGFGYYQGDKWQQEWNSDTTTMEQIQQ
jgi:hypothetical protein